MRTKRLAIIGTITISTLGLMGAGLAVAVQVKENQPLTLRSIAEQCKSNIDNDGFGHAKIKASHIQKEDFKMHIPCILELEEGSTLQLTNVSLETSNLFVTTEPNAKKPVHVVVKNSTLKSLTGGIYIQLPITSSSAQISNSQLSYPLSIGVSVGSGDDDKKAALNINSSSFYSNSRDSEGILLVSTGHASFNDNQFKLSNPNEDSLLVAPRCESSNNGRAIVHCQ